MVVVYFWIFKPCFFLNPRGITLPWFSSLEEHGVVDLNSFKEEHAVVFFLSGGAQWTSNKWWFTYYVEMS